MTEGLLTVNVVIDNKAVQVPYTSTTIAEDVCITLCKQLSIGPVARHLFALRICGKQTFLMPAASFTEKNPIIDFRVRYKIANISRLKEIDRRAYDYYFHQARNDVLENRIPDLVYEKYKRELVGLGVTDMYRVMLEKDIPREIVESDYKKYIPKEVIKRHSIFIKKPIHDTLGKIKKIGHDAWYVKMEYLKQLELMAPEYLAEEYKALTDQDGSVCNIHVKVSPYHATEPGIRISYESKREEWQHICTIEELCYISVRKDGTVEISRKNGIPFYLKFNSLPSMLSFVSLLDGYYRLTCKWIFNLCKDVPTPSLQKLYAMKCHGPVGGEFSYAKLEEKRGNRPGCFILRESESKYNIYYIDVCMKDSMKPKTFKLERLTGDEFIFNDDLTRYKSIHQLMAAYNDPQGYIYLQECLPPSEYDKSPLLLCQSNSVAGDSLTDSSAVHGIIPATPLCINSKDIQVYKVVMNIISASFIKLLIICITNIYGSEISNLTDLAVCKVSHLGLEYRGYTAKTESGVRCQFWHTNMVHKVDESFTDEKFPDFSKKLAKNYCRNPNRNPKGPWCYTMDPNLIDETCAIPLCVYTVCRMTGPGIEYGGQHSHGITDRKCLKWNKARNRIKYKGSYTKQDKFSKEKFPDKSLTDAKRNCRNPDGDVGGPWCFVEVEDTDEVEREYCDIPFCDDEDCTVFSRNSTIYTHYTDFNHTLTNLTFGLKIWDSDSFVNASARLILSLLALPLTGKEIGDAGIGVEIFISNQFSALTYGNKDQPEYEPSVGMLKSTEFTFFSLTWTSGFISLNKEGNAKPIFLAEYKTKSNLLGYMKDKFYFYAAQGTNVLWSFPFCDDDDDCDVHTTNLPTFQQFWPLHDTVVGHDLKFFVRASHSANILLVSSPMFDFPRVEILLGRTDSFTRIYCTEYENGAKTLLKEIILKPLLDYCRWNEFSISLFADTLNLYWTKDIGTHMIFEIKHEIIRKMRWFSPSSENSVTHWTFYCKPPRFAIPPNALLPECVLNENEPEYEGTQAITSEGLPCTPWSSIKLLPENARDLYNATENLKVLNYCRDPKKELKGTYCYTIEQSSNLKIEKRYCHIRKCKSAECRMAGTGNDYIGKLNRTRSNRTCANWSKYIKDHNITVEYLNDTLYPDTQVVAAKNYCRNPSRNIAGSWCYIIDRYITEDICNVRDCDKPEECIILIRGQGEGQKREGQEGITIVYRSMWRLTKGKKMEVAMKVLKHDYCEKYLKDFLELTGHWAFLQSNAVVRLYGITLTSPVSMVLEHMRLGPLDQFLRSNKTILKPVDLVEAASNLASALWHLEENGIVHGNIRCRKLLVSCHEENAFTVKLGDPGIHHSYASKEVHWIPVECYSNLEFAKRSTAADVWSFATTLWEIFMFGEIIKHTDHLDAMRFYASGKRLPQPPGCPNNIYQLMRECWDADPHRRKQPQALMRDINQILYQVYNSRRVHSYAKVFTKSHFGSQSMSSSASTNSLFSTATESTAVMGYQDELISVSDMGEADSDLSISSSFSRATNFERTWLFNSQDMENSEDNMSCDFSTILSNFNFSVATSATSLDSISSMQSIFELDADCNVILQGRIGQGFYGEVYKGTLEYLGDKDSEPRQVAVKKLKTSALSTCLQDFEREISIMKTLKHPNIVEILGVLQEPEVSLVMEFVQHGSLQSYLKIYRESLSTKQLLKYALDIAKGMDYLGTKHIVHRDLAARNILVVDENHVKISDFGLAQVMGTNEYYILKTNRELPIKWYAPESLRDGKFSPRSDVWSYAVTMCEMFGHGEEPKLQITDAEKTEGQEQQILLNAIESGARFPCPPMCPQAVYVRIIYPCWQADPHERPTFDQLCEETEDLLTQH